ncbi:hypothetical protein [Veillonella caviae]|uniref:hypothetical protein n=1 Tax=Veillonella caviae TaxID=248316 RepID=UPI0023A8C5D6|nr:hypothetical protein [Veillonella caviae]MCI5708699.1 hypothetical protein [Veillonella caviae]MCI6406346.1 hypothetical protein [Veillonella caviae]MDY5715990.1 hypothetical protein [Veillonella caviae]MDY6225018.1 hypothetical protein [Veillonella caviae]
MSSNLPLDVQDTQTIIELEEVHNIWEIQLKDNIIVAVPQEEPQLFNEKSELNFSMTSLQEELSDAIVGLSELVASQQVEIKLLKGE